MVRAPAARLLKPVTDGSNALLDRIALLATRRLENSFG
jgi:hypothetical protein